MGCPIRVKKMCDLLSVDMQSTEALKHSQVEEVRKQQEVNIFVVESV